MNKNKSISNEIKKRSFRIAANISVILFITLSLLLFANQVKQQHKSIEHKLEIDSEFIVNAIKLGDLFFITKYLSSFVKSGVVDSCGIKKTGNSEWIGILPNEDSSKALAEGKITAKLLSTKISNSMVMKDQSNSTWKFYYSYQISHFFLVYAGFISIFMSIFVFLFLNRMLRNTANFFAEPVENLYRDLDAQISNPTGAFQTLHYQQGQKFQETDRFVAELDQLISERYLKKLGIA